MNRFGVILGLAAALLVAPAQAEAPKGRDLGEPRCQRDPFTGFYTCRQGTENVRTYRNYPEMQSGYREMQLLREKRAEQNRFLFNEPAPGAPPPQFKLPKQAPDALAPAPGEERRPQQRR